jgi:hypothetical protein
MRGKLSNKKTSMAYADTQQQLGQVKYRLGLLLTPVSHMVEEEDESAPLLEEAQDLFKQVCTVCPQLSALNCLPSTVCPQLSALN